MKSIIRTILVTVISVPVLAGCLEKYPADAIPSRDAIRTADDAQQALNGIYASFKSSALYSGLLTILPDIQTDLVQAVQGYSNTYGNIWRWEFTPTDSDIESVYGSLYAVIGQCNWFLESVAEMEGTLVNDDDIDDLQVMKGEVYFFRALCYSELVKCFCKPYENGENGYAANIDEEQGGVVLVSSYYEPGRMIRSTLREAYGFINADLDKAEELVDQQAVIDSRTVSINVVNALRARVYLNMQEWAKAEEYATRLIEESGAYLASATEKYTSDYTYYQYMWNYDSSPECLWTVGFTSTSYGGALGQPFLGYDYISYMPDYVPAETALSLYAAEDARYTAFFSQIQTGYDHHLTWPLLIKYRGNQTFINTYNIIQVSMPKVFRLSEAYLIRSEARCRLNDFTGASEDLSDLRRSRFSTSGSITLSPDGWEDTILEERARELYMEGFRLNDLKRFHRGFEREEQAYTVSPGNAMKIEADNPRFVWPIPQHELDAPGSEIKGNESNS